MFVGLFFLPRFCDAFVRGFGSISLDVFTKSTHQQVNPGTLERHRLVVWDCGGCDLYRDTNRDFGEDIPSEFGDRKWFGELTRFVADIMLSAPSMSSACLFYCLRAQVKHHSGWAGSIALSLIAIPVVMRTTDNMLALVPTSLRERLRSP